MSQPEKRGARRYRMRARAEAKAATADGILDAAESAFDALPIDRVTLAAVAERAGVTVQTVLRHYGSRQALFAATIARSAMEMTSDRDAAPVGDVEGSVGILVDHYEVYGDRVLRVLGEEERDPVLRQMADVGRVYHADWCKRVFAPGLKGLRGARRERRLAQLVTLTDIYTWKLLRRERGLSPRQTALAICELIEPLMRR